MKTDHSDMHILYETDKYYVGHSFEDAYLIDKRNGQVVLHDSFYGDPACALISTDNDWAVIAGEHITVWKNGKVATINEAALQGVCALRTRDSQAIEILIDPWADHSAIWTLEIAGLKLQKVRDFDDYKDKPFTDRPEW